MDAMYSTVFALLHLLLVLLNDLTVVQAVGPIIPTDKGFVQGITLTPNGKKVDVFYGIPYAKPPIGKLRYRPPEHLDPWEGVWNATQKPNACVQLVDKTFGEEFSGTDFWNANTNISEDCLYLNVYAPRTNPPYENKAVLVWIYGGSFFSGSSSLEIYDSEILAAENDIIVVTLQYRVASLGFLVLDTEEARGNQGLLDQRMVLDWVQRNIHHFGGSPRNVTLMGESAGAVSVGLHLLSSLTRGMFDRAILQSGAPQVKWGTYTLQEGIRRSRQLAQLVGCDTKGRTDSQILECLRQKPAHMFQDWESAVSKGIIQFPFVPVIDGIFLDEHPDQYLRHGRFKKAPLLLGSNVNEGSFFIIYEFEAFNLHTESTISRKYFDEVMNEALMYYPKYPYVFNEFGKDAVKFQYTDWVDPHNPAKLRDAVEQVVGDVHFICDVNELARVYAKNNNRVYYYRFAHRWPANPWPPWMGVMHGDEIWYTFGHPLNRKKTFTEAERTLSRKMMKYWTNFAKTGDPNHSPGELPLNEWPVFTRTDQLYINLTTDNIDAGFPWGSGPRAQHCAFWDHYIPKLVAETIKLGNCDEEMAPYGAASPALRPAAHQLLHLFLAVFTLRAWSHVTS